MLELKLEAHAGPLPLHRGWLSGRRWRRLRHRRAAWWRLRPRRLGGRRGAVGLAAQPLAGDEGDGTPAQQQPPAFAPGTSAAWSNPSPSPSPTPTPSPNPTPASPSPTPSPKPGTRVRISGLVAPEGLPYNGLHAKVGLGLGIGLGLGLGFGVGLGFGFGLG